MSLQRAQEIPRFNLKCSTLSDRVVVSAKVKQDWPCGLALQTLIGITLTESKHRKSIKEANSEVTSVMLWGKNNSQPCLYNQTVLKASIFIIHFPCWYFISVDFIFYCCKGSSSNRFISKIHLTTSVFWVSVLFFGFIASTLKTSSIIRSSRMIWTLMTNSWEKRWASIVSRELTPDRNTERQNSINSLKDLYTFYIHINYLINYVMLQSIYGCPVSIKS